MICSMWNGILFIVLLAIQLIFYLTAQKPSSLSLLGNSFQGIALVLAAIQFTKAFDVILWFHPNKSGRLQAQGSRNIISE